MEGLPAFSCPIMHEIMTDPVVAADGHTYERAAIQRWFDQKKQISPLTGMLMASKTFFPNTTLRKAIEEYRLQQLSGTKRPSPPGPESGLNSSKKVRCAEDPLWDESSLLDQIHRVQTTDDRIQHGLCEESFLQMVKILMDRKSVPVIRAIFKALQRIIKNGVTAPEALDNMCSSVLYAMDSCSTDRHIQIQAFQTLGLLAKKTDNVHRLCVQDAPRWIVQIMACYTDSNVLQTHGMRLLITLVDDADTIKELLSEHKLCEIIVFVLRTFLDDKVIQSLGCRLIARFANNNDTRRKVGELGTRKIVLTALRKFRSDRDVQLNGCIAVCALSLDSENASKLAGSGVMKLLDHAMQTFPRDLEVQRACLGSTQSIMGITFVQVWGGVHTPMLVTSAMRDFPEDVKVVHAGCCVLRGLGVRDLSNHLGLAGACEIVASVLDRFSTNLQLVRAAVGVIEVISSHMENSLRFNQAGVCESLPRAMVRFQKHKAFQLQAWSAITTMAKNSKEVSLALGYKTAVVDGVTSAMRIFPNDIHLQRQACKALRAICSPKSLSEGLHFSTIRHLSIGNMRRFPKDGDIQQLACSVLATTLTSAYDHADTEACEALVTAMQTFPDNETLQLSACEALDGLIRNQENRTSLQKAGLRQLVLNARNMFQDCPDLQMLATKLDGVLTA